MTYDLGKLALKLYQIWQVGGVFTNYCCFVKGTQDILGCTGERNYFMERE